MNKELREKPKKELESASNLSICMCMGVAFGVIFNQLAIGIAVGVAIGAGLDAYIAKRNKKI